MKKAAIIGSSGLVGKHLVTELIKEESIDELRLFVRTPSKVAFSDNTTVCVTDFSDIEEWSTDWSFDVLFCCIGTTRKKTPNLSEYKAIDYGITKRVAEWAKKSGCKEVHLISSVAADAQSKNFYLKIKGETEQALTTMGFTSLQIYRPGMLIGSRIERRFAENIGQKLSPIFDIFTFGGQYHSIKAQKLAKSMCSNMKKEKNGVAILTYKDFKRLLH
jgi:uncharacterized protein YbjT (DUF2867 family)